MGAIPSTASQVLAAGGQMAREWYQWFKDGFHYRSGAWTSAEIAALMVDMGMVGWLIPTGSTTVSDYCLAPYGQNVSRTTYSLLFAKWGTDFGVGDGSTTFGIMDIRGRVIAGKDNMGGTSANRLTDAVTGGLNGDVLGDTGGEESHTQTLGELVSHPHNTYGNQLGNTTATGGTNRITNLTGTGGNNSGATNSVGGGGAFNVVQPTIILPYMVFAGQ